VGVRADTDVSRKAARYKLFSLLSSPSQDAARKNCIAILDGLLKPSEACPDDFASEGDASEDEDSELARVEKEIAAELKAGDKPPPKPLSKLEAAKAKLKEIKDKKLKKASGDSKPSKEDRMASLLGVLCLQLQREGRCAGDVGRAAPHPGEGC
jgi:hypothetical protein